MGVEKYGRKKQKASAGVASIFSYSKTPCAPCFNEEN
jgi:hypothetical protein